MSSQPQSRIERFKLGKGKTTTSQDEKQWTKEYFEVEVSVPLGTQLSDAVLMAEKTVDEWLGIPVPTGPQAPEQPVKPRERIDLAKINWHHQTPGTAGVYSLAREDENKDNPSFDALSKLLEENRGKATVDGNFAWLFPDGTAIGMKPRQKKAVSA